MEASRNQGKILNGRKRSSASMRSQKPCGETFVTSTSKMLSPGRADFILVLPNPFFAVTDSKGFYRISNVPAGTYKLKAWYERLPAQEKEITVPENGEVTVDMTLTVAGLPEY